jgi:predicted GH43/DUF377 family glycosyl hydrolase
VIAKTYLPGEEIGSNNSRAGLLMSRVLAIPEAQVQILLAKILVDYSQRHSNFTAILQQNFALVAPYIHSSTALSHERQLLIGAYFTHEYSVEGAALFNPSMVLAPNGDGRFIMSLRAVGEGHISSIEFRSGTIDAACNLIFDPSGTTLVTGRREFPKYYDKQLFCGKLDELGATESGVPNIVAGLILDPLPEQFTFQELEKSIANLQKSDTPQAVSFETVKMIHVLAASNYIIHFPAASRLAERVLFPAGPNETRGMEDARFVRFTELNGSVKYYATYTAFDGFSILPQLIETTDFLSFRISTLSGAAAQNKGMALFPRQIHGKYVMLSRKDQENLHLSTSTDVRVWNDVTALRQPSEPWELLHIGNCGSPLETEAGWLVITHGVGPMRSYTLSAMLLDIDNPGKVRGFLRQPLLIPNELEREGYVPNVLYSCGGMVNGNQLVLPYGISDKHIGIALISLPELLEELQTELV